MPHDQARVLMTTEPGRAPINDRMALRALLVSEDTHGMVILIWALDGLGQEFFQWAPETIKLETNELAGFEIPKPNYDKLMAAVAIVTTDLFFRDVDAFIKLCNVLSGDDFMPTVFSYAGPEECAWGITEALILDPPDSENEEPFSDEIRRYIGFVLHEEGYIKAPDILQIAIDHDLLAKTHQTYADSPEMLDAILKNQKVKEANIERVVMTGLRNLLSQLESLPLREGSTADICSRLRGSIKRQERQAEHLIGASHAEATGT
jgi:hypothetical protein